jgi:mannose-6-phosphate isomerase
VTLPAPQPVVFAPEFHVKPWGGRRLAELLNKTLPPGEPVGEAWELCGLPGRESRVARGPLAGRTIQELLDGWGPGLLGDAAAIDGRFPLLLKYLDARENLSVQVHPKPAGTWECRNEGTEQGELENAAGLAAPAVSRRGVPSAPVKHEAWYIVAAEPGAVVYIGLRPGVTPADVTAIASTSRNSDRGRQSGAPHPLVALLQQYPATPGRCFYLPSGTLHALGAGAVVAEVQTPSDVTYRLYDWDRVDTRGRPRELHIAQALANIRYDVSADQIAHGATQPHPAAAPVAPSDAAPDARTFSRPLDPPNRQSHSSDPSLLCSCDRFTIARRMLAPGRPVSLDSGRLRIWMVLSGRGALVRSSQRLDFEPGETLLIPAGGAGWSAAVAAGGALLEIHAAPAAA